MAGCVPWFYDYGIDLSRGNRGLKVWCALEMHGEEALAAAITDNCRLAALMADEVEKQPRMALGAAVVSNVCVFTARKDLPAAEQTRLNTAIAQDLQERGEAVYSTTRMGDRGPLRRDLITAPHGGAGTTRSLRAQRAPSGTRL